MKQALPYFEEEEEEEEEGILGNEESIGLVGLWGFRFDRLFSFFLFDPLFINKSLIFFVHGIWGFDDRVE